jgi:DNA-binding XRE family transcriptional regulator
MKFRLKACRAQAGLLSTEAAELIGVTETTLNSWENGKTSPSMEKGLKMSLVYKIPLMYMDFTKAGNKGRVIPDV